MSVGPEWTDYSDENPVAWRCVDTDVRGEARALVLAALVVLGVIAVWYFAR